MNDLRMIEKYAKMMAVGNNGGDWDTHYTEKQKDFWRGCAVSVISECYDEVKSKFEPKPTPEAPAV